MSPQAEVRGFPDRLNESLIIQSSMLVMMGAELEFYSKRDIDCLSSLIRTNKWPLVSSVVKERGVSQYEIITSPTSNLRDLSFQIQDFKDSTQDINDFSAKPFLDQPGSAMHIHLSLHQRKFPHERLALDPRMKFFIIGGLCKCIRNSMKFFAPGASSYKRFQYHDKFTPRFASWGFEDNKSNAIRVTKDTIEHRVAGADANIGDVIEQIARAISFGIDNKVMPGLPNFGELKYSDSFKIRIPLSHHESVNLC